MPRSLLACPLGLNLHVAGRMDVLPQALPRVLTHGRRLENEHAG